MGAITGAVKAALEGGDARDILAGAAGGAVSGAISGFLIDVGVASGGIWVPVFSGFGSALGSVAGDVVEASIKGEEIDWEEVKVSAMINGGFGLIGGGISDAMNYQSMVKGDFLGNMMRLGPKDPIGNLAGDGLSTIFTTPVAACMNKAAQVQRERNSSGRSSNKSITTSSQNSSAWITTPRSTRAQYNWNWHCPGNRMSGYTI